MSALWWVFGSFMLVLVSLGSFLVYRDIIIWKGQMSQSEGQRMPPPELDTSRMFEIDLADHEIAEWKEKLGGTFCHRNRHILVTDRDGRRYLCLMTPHNLQALWRSRFVQGGGEEVLRECLEDVCIEDVVISSYPMFMRRYDTDSWEWRYWASLSKEFEPYRLVYKNYFQEYFLFGAPRMDTAHA